MGLLLVGLYFVLPGPGSGEAGAGTTDPGDAGWDRTYLPNGPSDQVVHHAYYSLGYDEDWEQARWVAYRLTPKQLRERRVKRTDDFRRDPTVRTVSAEREDYRGSGYTRGHLVPAGDMGFSREAMSETFLLSNVSPQRREHNGAVWRELEETTREWILDKGPTYVVTGPVVGQRPERIGRNGVAVPDAFYKVLLTEAGEGVAFVIPHELQTEPLGAFAVSIDEAERQTGLDFFPELTELATDEVEGRVNAEAWPHSDRRYRLRLDRWNKQR